MKQRCQKNGANIHLIFKFQYNVNTITLQRTLKLTKVDDYKK